MAVQMAQEPSMDDLLKALVEATKRHMSARAAFLLSLDESIAKAVRLLEKGDCSGLNRLSPSMGLGGMSEKEISKWYREISDYLDDALGLGEEEGLIEVPRAKGFLCKKALLVRAFAQKADHIKTAKAFSAWRLDKPKKVILPQEAAKRSAVALAKTIRSHGLQALDDRWAAILKAIETITKE